MVFVLIFFSIHIMNESIEVANVLSTWVDEHVIQNEATWQYWSGADPRKSVIKDSFVTGTEVLTSFADRLDSWVNTTDMAPVIRQTLMSFRTHANSSSLYEPRFSSVFENLSANNLSSILTWRNMSLDDMYSYMPRASNILFSGVVGTGGYLLLVISIIMDAGARSYIFVTCLFYSLNSPTDILEVFTFQWLPLREAKKPFVLKTMRDNLEGELLLSSLTLFGLLLLIF